MRIAIALLTFITGCLSVVAQTGPGGIGSSTNNVLWIEARNCLDNTDAVASNGERIRTIVDNSGNGNNILQTVVNQRALMLTNHLNGFPAIDFDGVDDNYTDNIGGGNYSELDVITVMNFDLATQPSGNTDYVYRIGQVYNQSVTLSRSNANSGANADKYYSYTEGSARFGPVVDNSPTIYTQTFNGTSPFHYLRIDGAVQTVAAHNSNFNLPPEWNIGRFLGSNPHALDGKIVELIAFNSNLDTTERIILENHLASKYALTMAGSDKYAHDPGHSINVTGIGQESATDNHTDSQGAGVVRINSANDLEDGEYMMWGHDAGGTGTTTVEVPASYLATSGQKLNQEWRVDISGGDLSVGTVTVAFDLTGIMFGVDPADFRLLIDTDNDGDFTDASVNPALPGVVGSVITFTGISFADGNYFTIGNSQDIDDCVSLNTASWQLAIWDCGAAPDSTNNVTISDGTTITVDASTSESCNDLTIEADGGSGGGTLVLDDNSTLIVKGNLVVGNGAGFTFNDGSTLIMRGVNGNQAFTNNSGSTLSLINFAIDNTDGVTLSGTDRFELSNGLTLTRGNMTNNSTFTFLSNATSTATINPIPNGSIIDGSGVNSVQRFRDARGANWGNIGTSGVDTDLEDLNGEVFMSGIVGGNGYATNANGGGAFYSVYYWNPVTDLYVLPASTAEAMELGRGYEIWLADNINTWGAQAWQLDGDINTSTTNITVESTNGNWNLIANPFNSFLDWDTYTTNAGNITNDDYWYIDADLNTYVSVSAGGGATVPPGQGMWVQTTGGTTTVTFNPATDIAANNFGSTSLKRKSTSKELMVHLRNNDAPYGSAVYLRKDEMAFEGIDERDVTPLRVPDPKACRMSIDAGNNDLMLNYIPTSSEVLEVPIRVEPQMDGDYTLSFDGLSHLEEYSCINLRNEQTGNVVEYIQEETTIPLRDLSGSDELNFTLVLTKGEYADCFTGSDALMESEALRIWNTQENIVIDYDLDQKVISEVSIQNALGELVWTGSNEASFNRQTIPTQSLKSGLYIVSVNLNGNIQSEKIIVQR